MSNKKPFSCSENGCEKTFKYQKTLQQHLITIHAWQKSIKCKRCDSRFESTEERGTHFREKHLLDKDKKWSEKCDKCELYFTQKKYLAQHIYQVHLNDGHKCENCGVIGRSKFHNHKCNSSRRPPTKRKLDNDKVPEKITKRKSPRRPQTKKIKLHVDEKHTPKENKIICEVCTKTFDKIETLSNHMEKNHKETEKKDLSALAVETPDPTETEDTGFRYLSESETENEPDQMPEPVPEEKPERNKCDSETELESEPVEPVPEEKPESNKCDSETELESEPVSAVSKPVSEKPPPKKMKLDNAENITKSDDENDVILGDYEIDHEDAADKVVQDNSETGHTIMNSSNEVENEVRTTKQKTEKIKINLFPKMKCDECSLSFIRLNSLTRHEELVHSVSKLKSLEDVNEKTNTADVDPIDAEIKLEIIELPECEVCGKKFENEIVLMDHIKQNHKKDQAYEKIEFIKQEKTDLEIEANCEFKVQDSKNVKEPTKNTKKMRKNHRKCGCGKGFYKMALFNKHKKECQNNVEYEHLVKMEPDSNVNITETNVENLDEIKKEIEEETIHDGNGFLKIKKENEGLEQVLDRDNAKNKCNKCDETFDEEEVLKAHSHIVHELGWKDVCNTCGENVKNLKKHEQDAHICKLEAKYRCKLCGYYFFGLTGVAAHIRSAHKSHK